MPGVPLMIRQASLTACSAFSPVFDLEMEAARLTSRAKAFERSFSEHHLAHDDGSGAGSPLQQILRLFAPSGPFQEQLAHHVAALRGKHAAPDGSVDVEAMARELLALGYMVQLRDEGAPDKPRDPRSCLQHLRHRFIVCIGLNPRMAPHPLPHPGEQLGAGGAPHQPLVVAGSAAEPVYLQAPLLVEPRLREQFLIAHPSPAYTALLQAVPPCYVGTMATLESLVRLMCDEMVTAFKAANHSLPPWRTRTAILSKWAPAQLAQLEAKIAELARQQAAPGGDLGTGPLAVVPHTASLSMGERPAAAHGGAHTAFGSAPAGDHAHAASCVVHYMQPLAAAPPVSGAVLPPAGPPQLQLPPAVLMQLPLQQQSAEQQTPAALQLPVTAPLIAGLQTGSLPPAEEPAGGLSPAPAAYMLDSVALALATTTQQHAPSPTDGWAVPPASAQPPAPLDCYVQPSSSLRFTRKASAEWKHRQNGKKMKGLLAVALKKSSGASGSSSRLDGQARSTADAAGAALRQRSIRTSGDEPWARITTVRWGAFAPPASGPAAAGSSSLPAPGSTG